MTNIFDLKDSLHLADDVHPICKWQKEQTVKPIVSVVIIAYNHPDFFKMALNSALSQTFSMPYEIIITDNNQDDDIYNINEFEKYVIECNNPIVKYYKNAKNIGGYNNVNRGPQLASADYFVFLHDDDELSADALEKLWKLKCMIGVTNEAIVPRTVYINKNSEFLIQGIDCHNIYYKTNLFDWFWQSYTNGGSVLHNREAFIKLGGYNPNHTPSSDYAFYINYCKKYGIIYVDDVIFRYRIAENDAATAYKKCTDRDYQFRHDIIKHYSKLLQPFLNYLSIILYRRRQEQDSLFWGGEKIKRMSVLDKIVFRIVYFMIRKNRDNRSKLYV